MAQDHQSFALAFWRSFVQAKQKPLRNESEGAFESLTSALAVIFFNSSRIFKIINLPDPKP
jgi:hypothetical protein